MKKTILISIATVLVGILVSCLLPSKHTGIQTSDLKHRPSNIALISREHYPAGLEITKESERLMLEYLKRESLTLEINNLREATVDDQTEIRIWMLFDVAIPRCFILKKLNDDYKAFLVTSVKERGGITKMALNPPRVGWYEFDRFFKEQGIDVPIKLSLDEKIIPDDDIIVMEVKSGTQYSMAFFYLNTKSEDGQKALKVCRKIEQEFSIKMGCGKMN